MAGHSKWANIKHKKAKVDAQKGKIFTKLAKEIIVAAREGGGDPEANFRLRMAIQKAKEANLPNDNITRAIKKGAGEIDGEKFESLTYEGYGPCGVAILLEINTDNRNRTAADIRHLFSKFDGSLGETGCVGWMFDRKGFLVIDKGGNLPAEDELMLIALEAGSEDFSDEGDSFEVVTTPEDIEKVKDNLEREGVNFSASEVTMVPSSEVKINNIEDAEKLINLVTALEDHDDVQNVYANFDIPEEILNKIEN